MSRWETISEAYGLAGGDRTVMVGEAVKDLASSPSSRTLIEQGRLSELRDLLRDEFGGYLVPNERQRAARLEPHFSRLYVALHWRRAASAIGQVVAGH